MFKFINIRQKSSVILSFILLFSALGLKAQGGFKKQYYLQNYFTSISQNAIETPNKDIIIVGLTSDTANNKIFNRLTMIGTDSIGNYKWKKDYGGPNFSYLLNNYFRKADLVQDNNYFYYIGIVKDAALREFGVLIKFNYKKNNI